MPDIALKVNGQVFGGWKTARVTRDLEACAGGFELSVSDRAPWAIQEEDECTLSLEGQTVIRGYVDVLSLAYSATDRSLSVSGRDKTGALVDNSVNERKWEFVGTPVLTLLRRLAQPQGVSVSVQPGLTLPALPGKVTIDPGDSVFDAVDRVCRLVGVLPVSDGAGGLMLMRTGAQRAATELVEGQNILAASARFDATSRFRKYVVQGQSAGTDSFFGEEPVKVRGEATDDGVRRASRVLLVRPEGNVTAKTAKQRAQWEAAVRAARGDSVSVVVQGWTMGDGKLWPVNSLVRIRAPRLRADGEMLITQVVYSVDDSGTTTQLTLTRPDAYKPEPVIPRGGAGGGPWWKEVLGG